MRRQRFTNRMFAPLLCLAIFACTEDSPLEPGPEPTPDPGEDPPPATGNVAPEIAPIADQVVLRNTMSPQALELDVEITDPDDDTIQIAIEADDENVLSTQSLECSPGECPVTLAPSPERTAAVTVQVTATDGSGGEATAEFRLDVSPRLVTNADDSGPGSLRSAVAEADPGDVIAFDTAGVFTDTQTIGLEEQIVLEKVLTIEGPGAGRLALSGGGAVRVFRANGGADVVIRGVTITQGRAPLETFDLGGAPIGLRMGGGVVLDTGAKLTLSASGVTNSVAAPGESETYGGGIASLHGQLVLNEGTVITGNAAAYGGGIANVSFGVRESITRVENADIGGNEATRSGGGIYNTVGSVVVHEGMIRENTAPMGAGIGNSGTLVVEAGSLIAGNVATGSDGSDGGGGILNDSQGTATVIESRVESNTSAMIGGGILNSGVLTADRSEVSRNHANGESDEGQAGGGIYNRFGTATITGGTIEANTAVQDGAGIYNGGTLEVLSGSVIRGNEAGARGGGVYNFGIGQPAVALIRGSTLVSNKARDGGGVYNRSDLTIDDSHFIENSASNGGGGLRSVSKERTAVTGSTIERNTARLGGGIYYSSEVTIRGTIVTGNEAEEDGGGIYHAGAGLGSEPITTTIERATIEANAAGRGGGIFFDFRSGNSDGVARLIIRDETRIIGNSANDGGGLFQTQTFGGRLNAQTLIENAMIGTDEDEGGNAARNGAGIYIDVGVIELGAGSRIQGNIAETFGGGVYNDNEGSLLVRADARVSNNTAKGSHPITGRAGGGVFTRGTFENAGDVSGNAPDDITSPPVQK